MSVDTERRCIACSQRAPQRARDCVAHVLSPFRLFPINAERLPPREMNLLIQRRSFVNYGWREMGNSIGNESIGSDAVPFSVLRISAIGEPLS